MDGNLKNITLPEEAIRSLFGPYDENIKYLDLQKAKRELADGIITTDNSALAGLTREHLELLLE